MKLFRSDGEASPDKEGQSGGPRLFASSGPDGHDPRKLQHKSVNSPSAPRKSASSSPKRHKYRPELHVRVLEVTDKTLDTLDALLASDHAALFSEADSRGRTLLHVLIEAGKFNTLQYLVLPSLPPFSAVDLILRIFLLLFLR